MTTTPLALLIPAGFSAAISAGEHVSVTLLYNPSRNPVDRQLVEGVVTGSTMRLSIENQMFAGMEQFEDLIVLAPEVIRDNIDENAEDDAELPNRRRWRFPSSASARPTRN
jgi:ABC-2 type transport system permease protein